MSDSRGPKSAGRSSASGGRRRAAGVRRAPQQARRRSEEPKGTSRTGTSKAGAAKASAKDGKDSKGSSRTGRRAAAAAGAGTVAAATAAAGAKSSTAKSFGGSSAKASGRGSAKGGAKSGARATAAKRSASGTSRTKGKGSGRAAASTAASRRAASTRMSARSRHAGAAAKGAAGRGRGKKVAATNLLNYSRAGKKNPWRWLPSFRMIAAFCALMVLAGVGAGMWLYRTTEVPEASAVATAQTTRVYFSDGKTEMGVFSDYDRTIIPSDQIPQSVKDAVVASEDTTFYENRGISPRGIARAMINNIRGGARQGGSTITQQYVERYHTGTETSYMGKVREMVMALKIDQELSKDEILTRYLNTIYFGRGAYGIQEGARAYFDKDAEDLDEAEAALLVAVIPAPSAYDPANDPERAAQLWDRVITREVNETEVLTPAEADALEFPETIEPKKQNVFGGTNGYLLKTVRDELLEVGYTEEQVNTGGYKVISTVSKSIQQNTVKGVDEIGERPQRNQVGTVTLDAKTGAIRGMYGGKDYVAQPRNDATQSRMQAGSTFKTFTLIAALEDGIPLSKRYNGNSPVHLPGWEINNFDHRSYGSVDLKQATANSVNTAYAQLNDEVGPERTRETAVKLGLPEKTPGLDSDITNVLGTASPTVLEMAAVYQTIAAGGIHHDPYIVQKVENNDGSVDYEHESKGERVLQEPVATNATVALQGPPTIGSARSLQGIMAGRPIAGKTGTSEAIRSAWFVGFTPQLVTAVGMFQPNEDGTGEEPLTPWGGYTAITGSTWPTTIWGNIMSASLEGEEYVPFPAEVRLPNQQQVYVPPPPRPSPPPAPRQTEAPSEEPEEEPSEEPEESEESEEPEETEEPESTEEPEPMEEPEPTEEPKPTENTKPTEEPTQEEQSSGNGASRGGSGRSGVGDTDTTTEKTTSSDGA